MKIKAFLLTALLLAGVSAFAQEATEPAEEPQTDSFVTNAFGENWFIGGGIGWNHSANNPSNLKNGKWLTVGGGIAADFNFGKWIDPMWGIRAGFNGIMNRQKGLTSPAAERTEAYPFLFVHGDVMWNVTNQFKGYDKERKYNFIPYLSAGFYLPKAHHSNFGVGLGFLNKIRLTERLDLDLDALGIIIKDASLVDNNHGASGLALLGIATVGVSYKLGAKTGWQTSEELLAPATLAAAEAAAAAAAAKQAQEEAEEALKQAKAENEALAGDNEALKAENDSLKQNAVSDKLFDEPFVAYFEIGQATLSVKELEHFDRTVKTLLSQAPEKLSFTVTGLTDHNTGSARRNKQLQKQRANYIHKLLLDKYGLDESKFEVILDESEQNRFTTIELNRAVVIEKK